MKDEKRKENLRLEVLLTISKRCKQLSNVIETCPFSEGELESLLKQAKKMNWQLLDKLTKKRYARQMMLGEAFTHP